jgi:hypothetical protein
MCRSQSGTPKCSRALVGGEAGRLRERLRSLPVRRCVASRVVTGLTPQQLFTWRGRPGCPPPGSRRGSCRSWWRRYRRPPAVIMPHRAHRRSMADGIEFEIAGIAVRVGARREAADDRSGASRTQGELVIEPSLAYGEDRRGGYFLTGGGAFPAALSPTMICRKQLDPVVSVS